MAANEKFKKLVDLLHMKTRRGELDWSIFHDGNPVVTVAQRYITVEKIESDFHDPFVKINLYDSGGKSIDYFTDEDLGDLRPYSDLNAYSAMDDLYSLALNKAKGVDENIDAILDELDDHVPF